MTLPEFDDNYLKSEKSRLLIDNLRAIGLDKYLDLPQVAVMGDTSSGKSSVLSALSGITFPSSNDMTTRCPTQLILRYADTFQGNVHLQRFDRKVGEDCKIEEIENIEEVTNAIVKFTKQLISEGQKISDDSIVISLKGPQFMNLTLTDLPGIIRVVKDGEDKSMISKVRKLVKRYLEQERTIILAMVPAYVDMHNTEILQSAQDADPHGSRTVGIITKPDMVDRGAEESVVDLLLNKTKHLKLGYHVVKCRGQEDLNKGVSISEGVDKENEFFKSHNIWGDVDSSLKGIGKLGPKLVSLLDQLIESALPEVIKEVDNHIHENQDNITKFGVAMDSAASRRLYYSKMSNQYLSILNCASNGNYATFFSFFCDSDNDYRMRALFKKEEIKFQKVNTKTSFDCSDSELVPLVGGYVEVILDSIWTAVEVKEVDSNQNVYFVQNNIKKSAVPDKWRQIAAKNLNDLKKRIHDNRGEQLPIFPSYQIFCSIVGEHIMDWHTPTMELFESFVKIIENVYSNALEFLSTPSSLNKNFMTITIETLSEIKDNCRIVLTDALYAEMRPFTLNHYLFDILTKMRNEPVIKSLKQLSGTDTVSLKAVISILHSYGIGSASNEDREAMEMEMAINAYLKVAKKRVIDQIPMLIEQHLVRPFLTAVEDKLNLNDDKLYEILSESKQVILARKRMLDRKEALIKSKEMIMSL